MTSNSSSPSSSASWVACWPIVYGEPPPTAGTVVDVEMRNQEDVRTATVEVELPVE